jgi:hypothetical protein
MNSPILIGIGAGLVSAVLFFSTMTGSVLAVALFYVTALPGFLAGLGWGTRAAAIAGLTGASLTSVLISPMGGIGYFVTIGLPIVVLCHLGLLARSATETEGAQQTPPDAMEWYPPGRIVAVTALMAGSIAALSVPLLGTDLETYRANIQEVLNNTFFNQLPGGLPEGLDKEKMQPIIELMIRALPAASAIVWFTVMLLNMWSAGRIATVSGRSIRPWPDISMMNYPPSFALGFVASLLGTFAPGILSVIATGFAGSFLAAYVLLGLIVLHVMARKSPFKLILLGTLYLGILMFGWVALVVAFIGIGEPMFKFRARAMGAGPPDQGSND